MNKKTTFKEGFLGDKYAEHEDEYGRTIGRSREKETLFGDKYVEHEDENGNVIARSEVRKDIWGNEYVTTEKVSQDQGSSLFELIGTLFMGVLYVLWKIIKTFPFWGPYVFTLVLSCLLIAPAVLIIPLLLCLVLHTVVLIKCRKRQGKGKYRPAVISFLIYLVSFFLLGIPAIIYQIVWLVRDRKKNQVGGTAV